MSGSMGGPPTAFTSLTVAGVPTIGTGGLLPFTGNWWFVDATKGSDGNAGTANSPFATLGQAVLKATANNNDVICFTGTQHLTATLAWSKAQTHLIGLCDPLNRGKRARISPDPAIAGTAGFADLVAVTGAGCWFYNFQAFYGFSNTATALICWHDTAGHSCYDNVEFLGFGDGTGSTGTSNLTGARAMKFTSSTGESTWRNCVFGVDTTVRNVTNYTIEISGGAPRLRFENCTFESDLGSSGGASSHVLISTDGIDRYCLFKSCNFMSSTLSGGTAMAQAFNLVAAAGGVVLLDYCTSFGCTAWETSASNSTFTNMPVAQSATGGKAIVI
jgi:hypothetical protein